MDINQYLQYPIYQAQQENYQGFVPRADLKTEAFDTLIKQKGHRVVWEQAMYCSCFNLQSGQPNFSCPACFGKGYVYFDPKETRALVTSINAYNGQINLGRWDFGSAYLTPLSTDNVGFRDRFTFIDFRTKFSQPIVRGAIGSPDLTRYVIDKIVCVRVLNTIYREGIDFDKLPDGSGISWKIELSPNTAFSILYTMPPVYVAINPVHELRGTYTKLHGHGMEQFAPLPKQFQIKREDFIASNEF